MLHTTDNTQLLIKNSNLSNRAKNQLTKNGYLYINDIKDIKEEQLRKIRNLGTKTIKEILEFIASINFERDSAIELPPYNTLTEYLNIKITSCIKNETVKKCLLQNNIATVGELIDLNKNDIAKFRNITNKLEEQIFHHSVKIKQISKVLYSHPTTVIRDKEELSIYENIIRNLPIFAKKLKFAFIEDGKFLPKLSIDELNFSNKEKKIIKDLNLNDVDNFITKSYKSLRNDFHISEKSLNNILNKIGHFLVVYTSKRIYIGDIALLYMRKSAKNYLLKTNKKTLLNIVEYLNEYIESYINVRTHTIRHILDNLLYSGLLNSLLYEMKWTKLEINEFIYSYLYTHYNKEFSLNEVIEEFSNFLNKEIVIDGLNDLIASDLVSKCKTGYFAKEKSIMHYIQEKFDNDRYIILKMRLQGFTLQQIADEIKLTRERVRQIVKKVIENITIHVREDKNLYWFNNYDLEEKIYNKLFEDKAYHYLNLKYDSGIQSWKEIVDDQKADYQLKKKVQSILMKDKIEIEDKIIDKSKIGILNYMLEDFGNIPMRAEEFTDLFNWILHENNIENEIKMIDTGTMEKSLNSYLPAVGRGRKEFRYYDYNNYDWSIFINELNLDEWKSLEISTEILFKQNSKLMEEFNILHPNEIHNILKRLVSDGNNAVKDVELNMGRMPVLSIGESNRKQQVLDLAAEYSPIEIEKFAKRYSETYGIKEQTVLANYLNYLENYIENGIIDIYGLDNTYDNINFEKEMNSVNSIIGAVDFVFYDDLKEQLNISIENLPKIISKLGYKKYSTYILNSKYNSMNEYLDTMFYKKRDTIDFSDLDKRLWYLSSFYSWLHEKIKNNYLVEFSPKKFITKMKLDEIGINEDIVDDFINNTKKILEDGQIWSISSIVEVVYTKDIQKFGFDALFYKSLLQNSDQIYSKKIGGTYLIRLGENFTLYSLVKNELNTFKSIDIYELVEILNEKYNTQLSASKIIEKVRNSEMYYDEIMEKAYLDLNYYYEEFE